MGGWLETDNRAISVQLNLTGTATGTELVNIQTFSDTFCCCLLSSTVFITVTTDGK